MHFEPAGGESVCTFRVPARYQSWAGIVHGGMVALMLDEAVGWAAWHAGHPSVTGKLEVRYRQPLRVGDEVKVVGRVERVRRTLVYAEARIEDAGGSVVAEASAVLMQAPTTVTAAGRPPT